jgi:hypothetical protein
MAGSWRSSGLSPPHTPQDEPFAVSCEGVLQARATYRAPAADPLGSAHGCEVGALVVAPTAGLDVERLLGDGRRGASGLAVPVGDREVDEGEIVGELDGVARARASVGGRGAPIMLGA